LNIKRNCSFDFESNPAFGKKREEERRAEERRKWNRIPQKLVFLAFWFTGQNLHHHFRVPGKKTFN
jgi:hypothetical protein